MQVKFENVANALFFQYFPPLRASGQIQNDAETLKNLSLKFSRAPEAKAATLEFDLRTLQNHPEGQAALHKALGIFEQNLESLIAKKKAAHSPLNLNNQQIHDILDSGSTTLIYQLLITIIASKHEIDNALIPSFINILSAYNYHNDAALFEKIFPLLIKTCTNNTLSEDAQLKLISLIKKHKSFEALGIFIEKINQGIYRNVQKNIAMILSELPINIRLELVKLCVDKINIYLVPFLQSECAFIAYSSKDMSLIKELIQKFEKHHKRHNPYSLSSPIVNFNHEPIKIQFLAEQVLRWATELASDQNPQDLVLINHILNNYATKYNYIMRSWGSPITKLAIDTNNVELARKAYGILAQAYQPSLADKLKKHFGF